MRVLKCLGRPFIVGGDWQVTPQELRATGFDRALGAVVCAPRAATNLRSNRTIDFFLVSKELVSQGWQAKVLYGCSVATHAPVILELGTKRARQDGYRLARPRPLPVARPLGPAQVATGVD